jgi:hypothetical protein
MEALYESMALGWFPEKQRVKSSKAFLGKAGCSTVVLPLCSAKGRDEALKCKSRFICLLKCVIALGTIQGSGVDPERLTLEKNRGTLRSRCFVLT